MTDQLQLQLYLVTHPQKFIHKIGLLYMLKVQLDNPQILYPWKCHFMASYLPFNSTEWFLMCKNSEICMYNYCVVIHSYVYKYSEPM